MLLETHIMIFFDELVDLLKRADHVPPERTHKEIPKIFSILPRKIVAIFKIFKIQ